MITPEEFGLTPCEKRDLTGGTPAENAQITRDILSGAQGAKRDVVLLNAGAGFYAAGAVDSIAAGVAKAAQVIDTGAALAKLEEFKEASNQ